MHPCLRRLALALAVAFAGVSVAACGGDDSSSSDTTEAGSQDTASAETPASGSTETTQSTGSGNDQVDEWAGAVCGSVGTWLTGINEKGTQLGADFQSVTETGARRDLLVTFMQDVVGLTDVMLGSVDDAGAPDIENGDQLAADLLAALQPVKATFEDAVVEAQNLPTDDPEAFATAATSLGNSLASSQGEFQTAFDALQQQYDDPALNAAFASVPACTQLG